MTVLTTSNPPPVPGRPYRGSRLAWAAGCSVLAAVGLWWGLLLAQGGHLFMVETPSMAQTAPVGTLVVTRPVDPATLHVGDIITFRPPGVSRDYTHRIVEVTAKGLRTKGDLNQAPDGWVVPRENVVGKAVHLWFGLGWLLRMTPWLLAGALLTAIVRSRTSEPMRAAVAICGASLSMSVALLVVRPLLRAETIGFVPVTDGMRISAVATGLLPIRATALDGEHVDLVAGQLGWVTTHQSDSHGRYQLTPSLHLPWWGWILMGLFCALPLVASLLVREDQAEEPEDPHDEAAGRGGTGDAAVPAAGGVAFVKRPRRPKRQPTPPDPVADDARPRPIPTERRAWVARLRSLGMPLTAIGSSLALAAAASPTEAAIVAKATVQNSQDTARSRYYTTCRQAMRAYRDYAAPGQLVVGYTLGNGSAVVGTDSQALKSTASASFTNVTQNASSYACRADKTVEGIGSVTLNGTSSKIDVSNPPSQSGVDGDPQYSGRFTLQAWFRTTTTRGGPIVCYATSSNNCSGRTVFMDNSGYVYFGVKSTTIKSPTTLNDGQWHLVMAQEDNTSGMTLWIDGALAATNTSQTTVDGNIVYPQIGYSASSLGFSVSPSSLFFAGDLQFVAFYGAYQGQQLRSSDVAAIYNASKP